MYILNGCPILVETGQTLGKKGPMITPNPQSDFNFLPIVWWAYLISLCSINAKVTMEGVTILNQSIVIYMLMPVTTDQTASRVGENSPE